MTLTSMAVLATRASRLTRIAALGALGLLASCGGGTSQVDEFVPERILVFGDDLSVLTTDGKKYSTNFVDDSNVLRCDSNQIWVQTLATHYGMVFSQCNPNSVANPKAKMLAVAGATVDGLSTQIQNFQSGDSLQGSDLVTVLIGMNDILEAYSTYPVDTEADLIVRMEAAGKHTAELVNAIAAAGPRVLISTTLDVGLTPFARQENQDHGDTRSGVLTRLTNAFNRSLRLELTNDGSKIGLLLLDDSTRAMVRVPSAFGVQDVVKAVCAPTALLPDCSNLTLISADASPTPDVATYMWADATRPGYPLHGQLGSQAVTRATNNPF